MKKTIIGAIALLSVIVAMTILGSSQVQSLFAGCQFVPGPLEGKSAADIERAAAEYACANFKSLGPAPRVRLSRLISPLEYMSLFGGTQTLCRDQQLALVIFEGDLELKNVSAFSAKPPRAKYVGLLFDLKVGTPTIITYSTTGDIFREALHDLALPERQLELIPVPHEIRACAYGQTAPTIMPPSQ